MSRILLVEDDEFIRRMINMRLQLRGHEIDSAVNGEEAFNKAQSNSYDLILMDMHMPVMDGHEATQSLREKGYGGLILAVTASATSADCEKAIKSGCNGYISKPIGADFEDRVGELLVRN